MNEDIVYRLRKRAEIRRQIPTRKSVQEGVPDKIADLLEDAANEIEKLRGIEKDAPLVSKLVGDPTLWNQVDPEKYDEVWDEIKWKCRANYLGYSSGGYVYHMQYGDLVYRVVIGLDAEWRETPVNMVWK